MSDKAIPDKIFLLEKELQERTQGMRTRLHIGITPNPHLDGLVAFVSDESVNQIIQRNQQSCNPINLMHYLDEHRPDGKMCLSNMECAQIEEYWINCNWEGIINYIRKYLCL